MTLDIVRAISWLFMFFCSASSRPQNTLLDCAIKTGLVRKFYLRLKTSQHFFLVVWRMRSSRKYRNQRDYYYLMLTSIFSPSHMSQLYSLCRTETKVWRTLPNGQHNDTIAEAGYFDYVSSFVIENVLEWATRENIYTFLIAHGLRAFTQLLH